MYLFYFSHMLMITAIFMELLLLLYKLPYSIFCLQVFCCFFLRTRANFEIDLWVVKFASQ
jgi:hypothetical protein